MKRKRLITSFLVLIMVFSCLTGCGSKDSATSEKDSGEKTSTESSTVATTDTVATDREVHVTVQLDADPGSLHPYAYPTNAYYRTANSCLYQQLFRAWGYGQTYEEWEPLLAESITKVDSLHYRIKLKENIYDSAGNKFTAADAVYSFQQQESLGGVATTYWKHCDISQCKVIDEYTFELGFFDASPGILSLITRFCSIKQITP